MYKDVNELEDDDNLGEEEEEVDEENEDEEWRWNQTKGRSSIDDRKSSGRLGFIMVSWWKKGKIRLGVLPADESSLVINNSYVHVFMHANSN